jgi:hypothetical protein
MSTKVYGVSDDLIEFEGDDLEGEVSCYDDECLIFFTDGTILSCKYGKADLGIWQFTIIQKGKLFDKIEICEDEDDDIYSDIVSFKDGKLNAWVATEYKKAQ